jgi:hypothetical protein
VINQGLVHAHHIVQIPVLFDEYTPHHIKESKDLDLNLTWMVLCLVVNLWVAMQCASPFFFFHDARDGHLHSMLRLLTQLQFQGAGLLHKSEVVDREAFSMTLINKGY